MQLRMSKTSDTWSS